MKSSRIAVCGGGVAAVEALLALRELLPIRPHIDLIAPNRDFVYQPLAVAEPFGLVRTHLLEIRDIAEELGAELHVGALERVDTAERRVVLASATSLSYDAAVVAVGARRQPWLPGAISFGGAEDVEAFAQLLGRLERGEVARVAFACPQRLSWTLPLYELALLTASRLAERGVSGVELTVVTPESDPLAVFGAAASGMLRGELSDRGIRLRAGAVAERLLHGRLELGGGEVLEVEEVVALPCLQGPGVGGLPVDDDGFVLIDARCQAMGIEDVYAAGDGVAFPVKQGGLATQQADVAAEWIAARMGAPVQPSLFEPVLRGLLLTGVAPMYLRASLDEQAHDGEVAASPLWSPPAKLAGRYLAPYLAQASTLGGRPALRDQPAARLDPAVLDLAHREARDLAAVFAEADARGGDFESALGWLEVIERLEGVLPSRYVEKRDSWRALVRGA